MCASRCAASMPFAAWWPPGSVSAWCRAHRCRKVSPSLKWPTSGRRAIFSSVPARAQRSPRRQPPCLITLPKRASPARESAPLQKRLQHIDKSPSFFGWLKYATLKREALLRVCSLKTRNVRLTGIPLMHNLCERTRVGGMSCNRTIPVATKNYRARLYGRSKKLFIFRVDRGRCTVIPKKQTYAR